MPEVENGASQLGDVVAAVRAASEGVALVTLAELQSRFPDTEIQNLLPSPDYADLKALKGDSETYYFSTLSMSESYAQYLFRVEEKNPLRMVAETVREDSRIYPRPTPLRSFQEPPFNLSEEELRSMLDRFGPGTGTEDIRSGAASNGVLYLYSSLYLEPGHAEGLIEWNEVERWNNP